jgi:hypothetical protein
MWDALSYERTGLSFKIVAGPRQLSHSRVWVSRDSWSYFTVSGSGLPQPGGPGPRIYIPQNHGGPVIPSDTGSAFRHHLRLLWLRWRYSNTSPRGMKGLSKSELLYRQAPWDSRAEIFFFPIEPSPCGHSPYATSSLTRRWVFGVLSSVRIAHIARYWKFLFCNILYRVGGTCGVYRLHHSIVHTLLLPTPRVGITIILYSRFRPPDVLSQSGLLMSSRLEGWPITLCLPSFF